MKLKDYVKEHGFYLAMIIIICIMFILGICKFHHIERVLHEMQHDINIMNIHSDTTTQTEYSQTIDFMENEITKFREFMEKQQEFMVWLIGLVGIALTAVVTFFEIKGRKDISNLIQEQYTAQAQKAIGSFIGGQDKIKYLIDCIEKEELAKNKKILFVFHDSENINLKKVFGILEKQKYCVSKKKIRKPVQDAEISHWTEKYDIIIYQVGENEFGNANADVAYARISKACNNKKVYCILYSEQNLNRSLYNSCFYVSNANYGLTVIERIFNLLYSV